MAAGLIAWAVLSFVVAVYGAGHIPPPPEDAKVSYCKGKAQYRVWFHGTWADGVQSHEFPSDARFSPFTFATHTDEYTMWRPTLKAGEGVTDVAETGNNSRLVYELNKYKTAGKVYEINTAMGPTDPNGTYHIYLYTTTKFHLVSMASMIFPSPDWFIGLYNIDMCVSDTTRWIGKRTINLYAWDAGTDSGKNFDAADNATVPPEYITLIKNTNDPDSSFKIMDPSDPMAEYVPKFGYITFELIDVEDGDLPVCYAHGKQSYYVKFQGQWTADRHPKDFPGSDARFSPLVAASHNHTYQMWRPGMIASPGVQQVAETGNPGLLGDELADAQHYWRVLDHKTEDGPIMSDESMELKVYVDKEHPYISAISMIFPSPDWFVGISSIPVCSGYFWYDGPVVFFLLPWDGGSDSNTTFKAYNWQTDPKEGISLITTDTMGSFYNRGRQHIPAMGYIVLEREKSEIFVCDHALLVFHLTRFML